MAAAARSIQISLKPHVPLIRFRKGGPTRKDSHVIVQNVQPIAAAATSPEAKSSRQITEIDVLPPKYSRKVLTDVEIQYIMRGGPE